MKGDDRPKSKQGQKSNDRKDEASDQAKKKDTEDGAEDWGATV